MELINFLIYLVIMAGIYGILSLTLNFQMGVSGMLNFGHVAFFCIGAYTSTLLVMVGGVPFLVGVLGAFIASGLYAFLIAVPTRNLQATYWAITTLGAAEMVRLFFLNEEWISTSYYSGGPFGIRGIPRPWESLFPSDLYPLFYLFVVLVFLMVTYFCLTLLTKAPFGRVMKAIREGNDLPLALGKDVSKFKIKSMVFSGAFAGVGGALLAHYTTYIDPYFFMPIETFVVWAMVIIGGKGNHRGALLGALLIPLFYNSPRFFKDYIPIDAQLLASLRMVFIGVLIVLVMLFTPEGIVKEKKREYKSQTEEC